MRRNDFNPAPETEKSYNMHDETYYDLSFDKDMISASFAAQYGIRLRRERDMSVSEFFALLAGLTADSPLGLAVRIRMERDPAAIRKMSRAEKRIRLEWVRFKSANSDGIRHSSFDLRDANGVMAMRNAIAGSFG